MTNDLLEQIKLFLPKYLSPEDRKTLYEELERFPTNRGFYLHPEAVDEDLLQGDGWRGLVAINFDTLEKRAVSGLIISNSCDIDSRNPRDIPTKVLFAPLISLNRYIALLMEAGNSEQQVESKLRDVRDQRVTSVFYLPESQHGPNESLVFLDDIHAHPLSHFCSSDRTRLFRLNQYGFYVLLIKLSIHLSRFQEDVRRYA